MLDVEQIRRDFPILARQVHGKPLVYLDSAATSQKPRAVIDALSDYYERYNANVHRGIHVLSEEATDAYEQARVKVARFINAPESESVVFVRNTTEAINLIAGAWGRQNLRPGDEIVVTEMEHHSNLIPWQLIAGETGARIRAIPILDDGTLDMEAADQIIGERTRLVSVVHVSSVLGTINPIAELARKAHRVGALMAVDAAQSVPHLPVDVQALDCDFLAFSGHKMCGPTGSGALYARREILDNLQPMFGGGGMIREVWIDHATWAPAPERFEAGTPDIADAIGLGVAVDYLSAIGMEKIRAHEIELTTHALAVLGAVEGVVIYGPRDARQRGGVIAFNLGDVHPHDVGTIVDASGVAIRAGHHCCQPLMRRLGVAATARASVYLYNQPSELDVLVQALGDVKELFSGVGAR